MYTQIDIFSLINIVELLNQSGMWKTLGWYMFNIICKGLCVSDLVGA